MKTKYILLLALIPFLLNSCRKDFEFKNLDYKSYNRLVGPSGGTINYYSNYNNDASNQALVSLDVPVGALDSLMVFNFYQYENYELATVMEEGFAKFGSKLIYFIPFYESEGYHERDQMESNYHASVNFKKPVKVTYHPLADYSDVVMKNWQDVELYNNFYKSTNKAFKVFRIKIPNMDEWGENKNIYVKWNNQGYANGYDATDINYITNGRWSASEPWGSDKKSMDNWEEVGEYFLNTVNDVVTFNITSTDYIYIIARDLRAAPVPNITNFASFNNLDIKRVSFDETTYKAYLSDNTVAVFDRYGNYQYRLSEISSYLLPNLVQQSVNSYNSTIQKITQKDSVGNLQFTVILNNGNKLIYNGYNGIPVYRFQYGFNVDSIGTISAYIKANFPNQTISSSAIETKSGTTKYIVYLSSNIKVYFSSSYQCIETYFYKMSSRSLPGSILDYFAQNFPNEIFSEINHTVWPKGVEQYDIYLVGNKHFHFDVSGNLQWFEISNITLEELPQPVITALNQFFPDQIVSSIMYIYSGQSYYYTFYFTNVNLGAQTIYANGTRGGK